MAKASAASVPTRGASHRSAICAACVRFGSTTIMRAPRFFADLQCSPLHWIGDARVAPHDERAAGVADILSARDVEARDACANGPAAAAQVLVDHPVGRADRAQRQRQDQAAAEVGAAGCADDRFRSRMPAAPPPGARPSRPTLRPRRCAPICPRRARHCGAWDRAVGSRRR